MAVAARPLRSRCSPESHADPAIGKLETPAQLLVAASARRRQEAARGLLSLADGHLRAASVGPHATVGAAAVITPGRTAHEPDPRGPSHRIARMTLFAGILSRTPAPVPARLRRLLQTELTQAASQTGSTPSPQLRILEDERFCCAALDIGVLGGDGAIVEPDAISLLAGEPLLGNHDTPRSRQDDLRALHEAARHEGEADALAAVARQANGVFAFIHLQPSRSRLTLAADKLSLRPIYYAVTPSWTIFSTVHRLFDSLMELDRTLDLRAMMEVCAFYFPLGDRMPCANVRRIRAAETVRVDGDSVRRSTYWRWDAIPVSQEPLETLAARAHRAFVRAVARRRDDPRGPLAYLSGGLDSRAVVAALVSQGRVPETFNFAWRGTLDHALGAAIAERLGTRHHEWPKPDGARTPDYAQLMADCLAQTGACRPEGSGGDLVWSGEGGSVALGHVHMHPKMVELMRAGDVDGAIDEFLAREDLRLPMKLFTPAAARQAAGLVREGIRDELDRLVASEPARRFHLFLLLNDQRRKLTRHFETIGRHRVELQLPFFDSAFLAVVLSVPVDACLGHRFYSQWLACFDRRVGEVPWQAYPDHAACPLPLPETLAYQWNPEYQQRERATQQKILLRRVWRALGSSDFPRSMLSRPRILGAAALHVTGLRDYGYALDAAAECHEQAKTSGGRMRLLGIGDGG